MSVDSTVSIVVRNEAVMPESISEDQSLLVQPHDENLPATDSNDIPMSDLPQPDVESQDHPTDDTAEPEIISKDDFNKSELENARALIRNLIAMNEKSMEFVTEQTETIEDLVLRLDEAKQQWSDESSALRACNKELDRIKNQLAGCKETSQRKVQNHQKKLADIRRDLRNAQKTVRQLRDNHEDLEDARAKLTACQEELSVCKDDLFRLQPMAQTPDSTISKQYESIGQHIVHWIDAEVVAFEILHPETEPECIFLVGEDKDASIFLERYPRAGEHLARYMVNRYLRANMFGGNIGLLGLPEETAQFLFNAEQNMAGLDPPRDPMTIATWRSETIKALATIDKCKEIRVQKLRQMNDDLFQELSQTLPLLFARRSSMDKFFQQVVWPAGELAVTILGSPSTYMFPFLVSPSIKLKPANTGHLKNYIFVDFTTGKCLKPDSVVVANQHGEIGDLILNLEPGLHRVKENGERRPLLPMTFLVRLFHPAGKRNNEVLA